MKLSTKTRYGVRALLDLALHGGKKPVLLRDISKRQDISEKYLQQIFHSLSMGGIVRSSRGAGGGFALDRKPSEIKLSEVMRILEGPLTLVGCVQEENRCGRAADCVTRTLWNEISTAIISKLDKITLDDLVDRHSRLIKTKPQEYQI
ncbi:MAG: Rrf2 family transcriptional regulator [Candidatus Omnitrophica bacterium]|nr:Rrf2 family transcriptional regulator [Candidatus Omnitrophota bacterium]